MDNIRYKAWWTFDFGSDRMENAKFFTDWHDAAACLDEIKKAAAILGFMAELDGYGIDTEEAA